MAQKHRIQTRKSWGARPPKSKLFQSQSIIHEFFLHYPGSPHNLSHIDKDQEQDAYMRGIQNFHMDDNGWADFGYTFAVFQDGAIYRGRGMGKVPAAQFGHNTGTIAVLCVIGNTEKPSQELKDAVKWLKDYCDKRTNEDLRARGHGEVFGTQCPGPHLEQWIPTLNRKA